jgi:hypothetical protein
MSVWSDLTTGRPSPATYSSELPTSTLPLTIELAIGKHLYQIKDKFNHYFFYNRENCFETTLIHLTERFNGKEVYLVGTMNQSTMLAQRTKKLIEELKPDTVLVQASEK